MAGSLSIASDGDEPSSGKDMVQIPKGEFTMGSDEHSDEPRHRVVLDSYLIDKYEVSNARYKEFMSATDHPASAYWDDPRLNKPNQPVVGVSWTDANVFCKWDGKRLPTEAEWGWAAKGPEGDNHYPWGHKLDPRKANCGQNVGRTMPVDSYPEGVSGFGIYNMAGNVFEWVEDWYDPKYYRENITLNPKGAEKGYDFANQGPVKVLCGGSWLAPETSLHTSHRFRNQPDNNSYGGRTRVPVRKVRSGDLGRSCAGRTRCLHCGARGDGCRKACRCHGLYREGACRRSGQQGIPGDPRSD